LGGAGPIQAGTTQVLVLIGLLAAEAVSILVTVQCVAAGKLTGRAYDFRRTRYAGGRTPGPRRSPARLSLRRRARS
ncbi:hypothetical protein ACGFMK_23405, partial [Amycolatopsis sp. NPDC049252]